jgi:protein-S-isoprenylcysteine O-methyltransferase Ste14
MSAMQICSGLWLSLGVTWAVGLLWSKPTQERAAVGSRILYGTIVVVAFWLMFSGRMPEGWLHRHLYERTQWTDAVGAALTAAGLAFALWARIFIGRNWSSAVSVKVGHELIRGGPYRFVRHPIYTGLLLAMLGTGIVRAKVFAVIAFLSLVAGFCIKLRIEERFMRRTFGQQYEDYSKTTGALVPRLWS